MRVLLALVLSLCSATGVLSAGGVALTGSVRLPGGAPAPGVFVTARDSTRGLAFSVQTDARGHYRLEVPPGSYRVSARAPGLRASPGPAAVEGGAPASRDLTLLPAGDRVADARPHQFLSLLPDGHEKRRFVVDCMGCHSLSARVLLDPEGRAWDEAGWTAATEKMLSFAGSKTMFPILPPDRLPAPTAAFASRHLTDEAIRRVGETIPPRAAPALRCEITEYDLPDQKDFPHDLMRDGRGRVLVTGMFSGLVYVLDPETARFETVEIPVPHANPRALDVDARGDWWILCGFPQKIARYRVTANEWDLFDIGMYGHSVGVDARGRAWFNGHFTRDPVRFGYVDAATGETRALEAPATPMPPEQGSPIPYELRVAPDGAVWISELAGNRLIRHDPATGQSKAYPLPSAQSGPRRFDIDADGVLWVPEFAGGKLARFDPRTERFQEIDFPTRDALPYCARVDRRRGLVWVSLCAADAIARVDVKTGAVVECELPARNAFIRHLDVDPESGEVWGAYSHSPNLEMRIVRLRVLE
jgi:virginiamycin B lyase